MRVSASSRRTRDRRNVGNAVLRGTVRIEDEIHFLERNVVVQIDDFVEDLPGSERPFGRADGLREEQKCDAMGDLGEVGPYPSADPVRSAESSAIALELEQVVEGLSRVIGARRCRFALDRRARREQGAGIPGVLRRDASGERGIHALEAAAGIERDALRTRMEVDPAPSGSASLNRSSGDTGLPHCEQRTTSRNPGMLMFLGPSCEIRRAPAGAPGSGGFLAAGFGARSRSAS